MDALSDVLRAVRLTGAIFFDVRASDPWVAESPAGASIVGRMFPGAEHLISYHVMTKGACWATVDGEPPIRLSTGDVVVFPHGDQHGLSSTPGRRDVPDLTRYHRPADGQLPFSLRVGDSSDETARIVCGFLACDARPFNPLLADLPRVLHVTASAGGAIGAFAQFALSETQERRPGGDCVLSHLSELMFVDVVRRYLESLPEDRTGWLAGLRDPHIGAVLAAMHRNPERDWTLDSLAREGGLSRTALAERFTRFVGQPPMQYLAKWRMQLAANQLRRGTATVAAIAERVGYESEAAFSRAFKKLLGTSPSHFRKPPSAPPALRVAAG